MVGAAKNMAQGKTSDTRKNNGANLGFEEKLWLAADKLRGHMDAAEYKHVVLGLVFLKYISDAFEERHQQLQLWSSDPSSDLYVKEEKARYLVTEDRDEYLAENTFWVPKEARWPYLQVNAKKPTIGKLIDDAMVAIEKENPSLKGVLSKDYARASLDKQRLGELIDLIGGLKSPDISILSDEFLEEVRDLPQKNLALELLRKLLNDEIKVTARKNMVQARSFKEMLERGIRQYQNRSIESAEIIEELIELARDMRNAHKRGEELGLSEDELAFYDALEVNDSAVKVLGDETLRTIARELVETIRKNVTIDWTVRESVRARMRTLVKRLLRKYGYPPDKQEKAAQTILEQAELLSQEWAA
jgi:Domain of unknown function (DUF3387)/HsdM N-terminal domain